MYMLFIGNSKQVQLGSITRLSAGTASNERPIDLLPQSHFWCIILDDMFIFSRQQWQIAFQSYFVEIFRKESKNKLNK